MVLTKCPHCGKTVPGAKRKCPKCGRLTQGQAPFWARFGVGGFCYILVLILGLYLIGIGQNGAWIIVVAGILLLGLRLLRIVATKK